MSKFNRKSLKTDDSDALGSEATSPCVSPIMSALWSTLTGADRAVPGWSRSGGTSSRCWGSSVCGSMFSMVLFFSPWLSSSCSAFSWSTGHHLPPPSCLTKENSVQTIDLLLLCLTLPADQTCALLVDPYNGKVHQTGRYYGDRAIYTCDPGHQIVGTEERVCQDSGVWSASEPYCKKKGKRDWSWSTGLDTKIELQVYLTDPGLLRPYGNRRTFILTETTNRKNCKLIITP